MKRSALLAPLALLSCLLFAGEQIDPEPRISRKSSAQPVRVREELPAPAAGTPRVQLAVLLDTSGSMSGMINQARTQLWAIVNEFLTATRDGERPQLEVALYHYGSPSLGADQGFIKQLTHFTVDLDRLSQELFRLGTSGGDEYCGWVIQSSLKELEWSQDPRDYKAIFIAGNESFGQGPVNYKEVCKLALERGIFVNTIHCSGGSDDGWKKAAQLAESKALRIETNQVVVEIDTPFDDQIEKLGDDINKTYIAYGGEKGRAAQARQVEMDNSSKSLGKANFSKRARTKGSSFYNNASWDLVDAQNQQQVELKDLKEEDLPEEMRAMSLEEREAYVAEKAKERAAIQKQIADLSVKRDQFVAEKRAELAGNDSTLGEQVRKTVRKQAVEAGFQF